MVQLDNLSLVKSLGRDEFDYGWLRSQLERSGYRAPRKKIHDLIKSGVLIGVKKGLYALGSDYASGAVCKELLANLIYGPSCISLEYALAYHRLIPERVEILTSVTPKRDKRFETPLGIFTYRYLSPEKYREGIDLVWMSPRHSVFMACPEKALADYVALHQIKDLNEARDARRFLLEDLRVEAGQLKFLRRKRLRQLAKLHQNRSLETIADFLQGRNP